MDTATLSMPFLTDVPTLSHPPVTDEQNWQAVLSRDASADGRLFYGVRSTGVYCKPSCPSRRPRREQVRFFSAAKAAEDAGFRACRRCHPNQLDRADTQVAAVERACQYIRENLDSSLSLDELGAKVGMSPFHLQRIFKKITGVTPKQYIAACRLGAFKDELRLNRRNVTEATYHAGYSSGSRVYEMATTEMGMTPASYRKGAPGVEIAYAITPCSLGQLLVARTERGICSVRLGDDAAKLERELHREFPQAKLTRNGELVGLNDVLRAAEGNGDPSRLPLDIRATAFQRRVYQALLAIPRGETRSYADIAKAVKAPRAHRAVARACATNPVALVVPCHRVVRSSGELAGYRWGLERKQTLLQRERAPAAKAR